MWIRTIIVASVGLGVGTSVPAQGLFNFDEIPGVNQEPAIRVDVGAVAIGFIRGMLAASDPATADILKGLRGVQLRVYHGPDNSRQFNSFIGTVSERLDAAGWQQMMSVQDEGSNVRIHMRMTEQEVSGLAVMVFDGAEAIFINIDGSVSAEDLGKVMSAFSHMTGPLPLPIPPRSAPVAAPAPAGN